MISDNHVYSPVAGEFNRLVGSNACVAGDEQGDASFNELFQPGQIDAMGFGLAVGNVEVDIGTQIPEHCNQKGRGRLPIHVKITPYADHFASIDGTCQTFDGNRQVGESACRRRLVVIWIEECSGCRNLTKAPLSQGSGQQRMPSNGILEVFADCDVGCFSPRFHLVFYLGDLLEVNVKFEELVRLHFLSSSS